MTWIKHSFQCDVANTEFMGFRSKWIRIKKSIVGQFGIHRKNDKICVWEFPGLLPHHPTLIRLPGDPSVVCTN